MDDPYVFYYILYHRLARRIIHSIQRSQNGRREAGVET